MVSSETRFGFRSAIAGAGKEKCVSMKYVSMGILLLCGSVASATPVYDTFGPLDEATFGGQGIPNDEVAVSQQFYDGDVIITVAMSATQRYGNPPLTNDGAGTYFAGTGSSVEGPSNLLGAIWNFNYYMKVEGTNGATPVLTDYQFDLYYDFDTSFDTAIGLLGSINVTNYLLANAPGLDLVEGSENLNFSYLATSVPGFINAPAGSFDPDAEGEYNFGIQVSKAGWGIETVAMDVQVSESYVPEPATLSFLAMGGLALIKRKRR